MIYGRKYLELFYHSLKISDFNICFNETPNSWLECYIKNQHLANCIIWWVIWMANHAANMFSMDDKNQNQNISCFALSNKKRCNKKNTVLFYGKKGKKKRKENCVHWVDKHIRTLLNKKPELTMEVKLLLLERSSAFKVKVNFIVNTLYVQDRRKLYFSHIQGANE